MIADIKKIVKQYNSKPEINSYAIEDVNLTWHACREDFSKIFKANSTGLYFSHNNKSQNISSFIEKTEDVLIQAANHKISKSLFFETNFHFALWIEPSEFWMHCPVKRSLFTLLLRCGSFYNFNNFENALFSQDYCKITKPAIQRFLYGFTQFKFENEVFEGIGKGWVSYFANQSVEIVCEKLIMPSNIPNIKFLIGDDNLWS
jgi:hypothetical protein